MFSSLLEYFFYDSMCIVFFSVLLAIYVWRLINIPKNLPPGPFNLPLVGYLPFFFKNPKLVYKKLREKYGDIYAFTVGQRYLVLLTSWVTIKEALIDKGYEFAGRLKPFCIFGWAFDYEALFVCNREKFVEQKRFLLRSLRQLGFGKNHILNSIQEEAEVVMNLFRDHKGTFDDIDTIFKTMAANVLCSVIFGKRFEYGDEKLNKVMEIIDSASSIAMDFLIFNAVPFLRYLPSFLTGFNKAERMKRNFNTFKDEIIKEHIDSFDPNSPRDLIDYYLKAMQEKGLNFDAEHKGTIFCRSYLRNNMGMLFFAGTETTANFLGFAIKMLLIHPDIQQKIQEEIDQVIGRSRLPTWSDKDTLIYTSATILEIHRYCTIVPSTFGHVNPVKAILKGYSIPKESCVFVNIMAIHHDPSLWKDPNTFNPNRFINENGKIDKPEYLIPFSAGPRTCLGENLANREIFISLASFLQNFTFLPVDNQAKEYKVTTAIIKKVESFKVKIECR